MTSLITRGVTQALDNPATRELCPTRQEEEDAKQEQLPGPPQQGPRVRPISEALNGLMGGSTPQWDEQDV